jgi:hypothetical protein
MKIVRVHYTTTAEFAPKNKENIAGIVKELKELNHPGMPGNFTNRYRLTPLVLT